MSQIVRFPAVGRDDPGAPKTAEVELLEAGKIADKYINSIPQAYSNVRVDKYVIMPNHVHMLLLLETGAPGSSRPTVSQIVGVWKRFVHKELGCAIFQPSFHDHVIRDDADYLTRWQYIDENPAKWPEDEYYSDV